MPTDMLREVLLRLPADELCRPRLVCRSWRCLTSDPLHSSPRSTHPTTTEYKMLCFVHSYGENFGACHVMTLGERRWRVAPQPPVTVAWGSWQMAAVGGMAYFLASQEHAAANIEMDSIALFDLVTEEWRPKTLNGPLTSLLTSTGQNLLRSEDKNRFHLSRLSGCVVVVHQNGHDSRTDIWFLDDIEMSLWTRRYSIPFGHRVGS
uniref:F-box domain-containing protein n=1 Tax=Setaria viridis TaxID=4556 RepID=A0A4U6VJV6_SETVI|nr:hypothetical protein SEVIR_3G356000v2 [Setaria viridis]